MANETPADDESPTEEEAASEEIDLEDYTKKERIINAYLVYPDNYSVSRKLIADLSDATTSYLSTVKRQVKEGEITQEDVAEISDPELQQYFQSQLDELLSEYDVPLESEAETESWRLDEAIQVETEEIEGVEGGVSREQIVELREEFKLRREEAKYERGAFSAPASDVAEAKFHMADRVIDRLNHILSQKED